MYIYITDACLGRAITAATAIHKPDLRDIHALDGPGGFLLKNCRTFYRIPLYCRVPSHRLKGNMLQTRAFSKAEGQVGRWEARPGGRGHGMLAPVAGAKLMSRHQQARAGLVPKPPKMDGGGGRGGRNPCPPNKRRASFGQLLVIVGKRVVQICHSATNVPRARLGSWPGSQAGNQPPKLLLRWIFLEGFGSVLLNTIKKTQTKCS